MAGRLITCRYLDICSRDRNDCIRCVNNVTRNQKIDMFEAHQDSPIPEKCPKLTYTGPAEQTVGFECPVCHKFTNPYQLNDKNECKHCGYALNI